MDRLRLEALRARVQQDRDDLDALFRIAAEVKELAPRGGVAPDDVLATRAAILRFVGERAMAAGARMPRAPSASARAPAPYGVLDDTVLAVFALDAVLRLRFAPEDPAARRDALPVVLEVRRREADGARQAALDRDLARLRSAAPWPRPQVITFGPHRVEAFPIGGEAVVTVDGVYRRVLEGDGAHPTATALPPWERLAPFFGMRAPTADATLSATLSDTVRIDGAHFRQYTERSTRLSLTADGLPRVEVSVVVTDDSYY